MVQVVNSSSGSDLQFMAVRFLCYLQCVSCLCIALATYAMWLYCSRFYLHLMEMHWPPWCLEIFEECLSKLRWFLVLLVSCTFRIDLRYIMFIQVYIEGLQYIWLCTMTYSVLPLIHLAKSDHISFILKHICEKYKYYLIWKIQFSFFFFSPFCTDRTSWDWIYGYGLFLPPRLQM